MFPVRCQILLRNILTANTNAVSVSKVGPRIILIEGISSSASKCNSNYYEALGISDTSTQSDIKAAYYKLSKQYHPDRNKGSESAATKFREISEAYEVLGNYKLRRLYDKGITHTFGQKPPHRTDVDDMAPDDDPETKFYKSRFKKSTISDASGRTPIYDFDEWSRAHYGHSFQRRKDAKNKWERQETQRQNNAMSSQNELLIFGVSFLLVAAYGIFYAESSYDTPKNRALRRVSEKRKDC